MQIEFLKRALADGWEFQQMLLERVIGLEAGEAPEWPAKWGGDATRTGGLTPAQSWHRINFSKGKSGDEIAAVVRGWDTFGG